jgi:DNA repair protein RecO
VSGAEILALPTRLQGDLEGILLGSYLAEHLLEFVQENEPGELYFRLLDATLAALAAGVDQDLAARWFEAWVLNLAGIFPVPVECPSCGRPYAVAGAVLPPAGDNLVCVDCAGGGAPGPGALAVGEEVLALLARFARQGLAALAADPPPARLLRRVEELVSRVRRAFLQRELKSYLVMQRALAGV